MNSQKRNMNRRYYTAKPIRKRNSILPFVGLLFVGVCAVVGGVVLRQLTPDQIQALTKIISSPGSSTPAPTEQADVPPMTGIWTEDAADLPNPQAPVMVEKHTQDGIRIVLIDGGVAASRRCLTRCGVDEFVRQYNAAAGLNGTFFANASLNSPDNLLIGPSLCGDEPTTVIGPFDQRPSLTGRPLVLLSATRTKIVPYDPLSMDDDTEIRMLLPTVTDAFLGGVWLVHNGAAADADRLDLYHVKDCNDPRRRAFFAILADGRPALGATNCSTSSLDLARALVGLNIREAVLLDSGFSTALVYGDRVLVSGHSMPGVPSRPVPHALMLFGTQSATNPGAQTQPPA